MKKFLTTLILLQLAFAAYTQTGMNVSPIFEGKGEWRLKFNGAHIEGEGVRKYNLTLFKSRTTSDYRLYESIESMIEADGATAIDKEYGYINGKLYYGFYQFRPIDGKYRYIFYRNSSLRSDEPNEVTIIYMEGYPTLSQLKEMFK